MVKDMDLSLDDIIRKTKVNKGRGTGGGLVSGRVGKKTGALRSSQVAARSGGKWGHDGFFEQQKAARTGGGFGGRGGAVGGGSGGGEAKVDISNLEFGVTKDDLLELFASYQCNAVNVHYDETGRSLGTADVTFETRAEAVKMISDFEGTRLDGKLIKMRIVGGGGVGASPSVAGGRALAGRLQKVGGGRQGGFKRRNEDRSGAPAGWLHDDRAGIPDEVMERNTARTGGGGGGRRGGGPRGAKGGRVQRSEAELDAELEAYMKK